MVVKTGRYVSMPAGLSLRCSLNLKVSLKKMKVIELKDKVKVGRFSVSGFIDDIAKCKKCGKERIYYEEYDSYFCPHCNVWLEETCKGPNCEFCSKRPNAPLPPKPNPNYH